MLCISVVVGIEFRPDDDGGGSVRALSVLPSQMPDSDFGDF
jgi:hypothetical protein